MIGIYCIIDGFQKSTSTNIYVSGDTYFSVPTYNTKKNNKKSKIYDIKTLKTGLKKKKKTTILLLRLLSQNKNKNSETKKKKGQKNKKIKTNKKKQTIQKKNNILPLLLVQLHI